MRQAPRRFRRADPSLTAACDAEPRFVTHRDGAALAAVTQLYRERAPAGGVIPDLMSR